VKKEKDFGTNVSYTQWKFVRIHLMLVMSAMDT